MTDRTDYKILSILQETGDISMSALSDKIGLSLSACHRRVKLLEVEGIITNYSAQLDRKSLGLEVQVFIEVKLDNQRRQDIEAFEDAIANMPEVLECHMISGEFDYLMRVAAQNTSEYEQLYRNRLSMIPSISQMKTLISLSAVKEFRGFFLERG
ncbi:MAG: Lrp/AsnC family transcriptional regulator [Rhodobacteraceae bacterium]|nr:Lrp/AsnC family transcriptional regulator [Paracoccaceae bacterium]